MNSGGTSAATDTITGVGTSAGKEVCLSGRGVTKIFGFGGRQTLAVDHVDFEFYTGELGSIVGVARFYELALLHYIHGV
jgi:ABC-type glutathione transport system ATPase component